MTAWKNVLALLWLMSVFGARNATADTPPRAPTSAPSAHGVYIIGFNTEDPCRGDIYEQTLLWLAQQQGIPPVYAPRFFIGQCMKVMRSAYWLMIKVDSAPMIARLNADMIPITYCTTDGQGNPGPNLPLTPPGKVRKITGGFRHTRDGTTKFLMPQGRHRITFELYLPNKTGRCYSKVGERTREYTFPHPHDLDGRYQLTPESYIH
jgi:hypothetical protein